MIKYKVWSTTIEKVEIERETKDSVFHKSHSGKIVCDRKRTSYYNYFDTFEDAKSYILTELRLSIDSLSVQISNKKKEIEKVILMQEVK